MVSPLTLQARGQNAAARPPAAPAFTGGSVVSARISSSRSDGVYVVVPRADTTYELGPCEVAIGALGVGPSTTDTTAGTAAARPVTLTSQATLAQGRKVIVALVPGDNPVIIAVLPKGA